MANAEDLNRLTSCSLVLLGHIFLSLGNCRESMNMVTPAMQLASKIPDVHVQLWASAILRGIISKWFINLHARTLLFSFLSYENLKSFLIICNHCDFFFFVELHRKDNNPISENEAYQLHHNYNQGLMKDLYQSSKMPEHNLINWTEGGLPNLSSDNNIKSSLLWWERLNQCFFPNTVFRVPMLKVG